MHSATVASHTEIFLLRKFAPELLSKVGKVSVVFVFLVFAAIAAYGWTKVQVDFEFEFFLTDDAMQATRFNQMSKKYGNVPYYQNTVLFFSNSTDYDYFSEES